MLDSVLAENVMAVHRQRRSGVLTAVGLSTTVRVAFQDGDPVAIDLGQDKDRLLADVLLACHRISSDQHRALLEAVSQGQSVAGLVGERGWATADEIGRSLQGVVEDALISFFGGRIQSVSFLDGAQPDFDYEGSAVRLRIAADVLLRTTSARIDEHRAILAEFGDFQGIYGFDEDGGGSTDLTDAERRLLDLVDGRTSLDRMAQGLRESHVAIGRIVHGLVAKRVIRRVGGTAPAPSAPTAPLTSGPSRSPGAESALRAATPTITTFEPHRRIIEEEPRRSKALLITLLVVLAVLAAVGVAVLDYRERQQQLALVLNQFSDLLSKREWAAARERMSEARAKAGNDLQALRQVEDLELLYKGAVEAERVKARRFIKDLEFGLARGVIGKFDEQEGAGALRAELQAAEATFQERMGALQAQIEQALASQGAAEALSIARAHEGPEKEKSAALEVIERWRVRQIESAESTTLPIQKRQKALDSVSASEPTARHIEQVNRVQQDLNRFQDRLREQIQTLALRLEEGDSEAAMAEVDRLQLRTLVADTPLAEELNGIIGRTDAIRNEIARLRERIAAGITAADDGALLQKTLEDGEKALATFGPKGTTTLRTLLELAREMEGHLKAPTPELQSAGLSSLAASRDLGKAITDAVQARLERLKTLEQSASALLENARVMARDGRFQEAEAMLKDLISRQDLRGTRARSAADVDLGELSGRIAKRKALEARLTEALSRGDVEAGSTLAREMGLKYLPLSIDSVPAGAEVWHGETRIGTTPMILDITAADRVDYRIQLRLPGYETIDVDGASAEAGWRIHLALNRTAEQTFGVGLPVTVAPMVVGDHLVTGSRSSLVRIPRTGPPAVTPFGDASVDDPIYALPRVEGDRFLLTTRNLVALQVTGSEVRRIPLSVASDLPVTLFRSRVIVDRDILVVAGRDGVLAATDATDGRALWRSAPGSPVVVAPLVREEHLLTIRQDGQLDLLAGDDGSVVTTERLGSPVIAAWTEAGAIVGFTATDVFRWDGTQVQRDRLPAPALAGAPGVMVTTGLRVHLRTAEGWTDIGRAESKPSVAPLRWNDHAVLITGRTARVIGPRGFGLTTTGDLLPPVVWEDRLVLISQDGSVHKFAP